MMGPPCDGALSAEWLGRLPPLPKRRMGQCLFGKCRRMNGLGVLGSRLRTERAIRDAFEGHPSKQA